MKVGRKITNVNSPKHTIRHRISMILCIIILVCSSLSVFASGEKNDEQSKLDSYFKDVEKGYWAYDQIMWMLENKIIQGVGDGKFNPNGTVTRGQFAKMMVLTLNLELFEPDQSSFVDVKKDNWVYYYAETAKKYLTGYRTSNGDYFKPSQSAVREDMAVALVKALNLQNEAVDENGTLSKYSDAGLINPNLRKYFALAIKFNLITGSQDKSGKYMLDPQGSLTRAQAATLLKRVYVANEDKVTYDEDKVTYDGVQYVKPKVAVYEENGKLLVKWKKINQDKLQGYKVVISKNDSTPQYPENGYLYYITDKNKTSVYVDNSTAYNGTSDFGQYLKKGEKYYLSVTAVYSDKNVPGNVVRKTYNGYDSTVSYPVPVVSAATENGKMVLKWNKIDVPNFKGYKVVISKYYSTPKYPDNGYLCYITDRNVTSAVIDNSQKYYSSDFGGKLEKGQRYYFSVTAIYNDKKVAGNAVAYVYPGDDNSSSIYPAPVVSAATENGKMVLKWNKIDVPNFNGYKVVISKYDTTPKYPDNGYLYYITDHNTTSAVIDNSQIYNGGDFGGKLEKGQKYYFSVTTLYNNKKVAGNTVEYVYPGEDESSLYPAPVVSAATENGKMVLKWNKIDAPSFNGYKVVISKNDSAPKYPDNGYLYYITDRNTTSAVIDNSQTYNGGDFGGKLLKGQSYYFSVTALYNDKKVAGNTVSYVYPGDDGSSLYEAPTAYFSNENGSAVLRWNRIDSPKFKGYKVVVSQYDATPSYPENGYLYYFTDKDRTYAVIDNKTVYNDGDFGKYLVKGQKYYFSVTALYDGKNVTSNVLEYTYKGENNTDTYQTPVVSVSEENGKLVVRWNKIDNVKFVSYRVVISKNSKNPKYPDNGYIYEIKDNNVNAIVIDNSKAYSGTSDFGQYLKKGDEYYFNVTAEYTDKTTSGEAKQCKYNGPESPEK